MAERKLISARHLPHFLSLVAVAGILKDVLGLDDGIVNHFIKMLGEESIYFLGQVSMFRQIIVISDVRKELALA